MQLLLKQVKIIDPTSPHHRQVKDVLIKNGKIEAIRNQISSSASKFSVDGALASPGWCDIGTWIGDPGYEQVEILETAVRAANRGGFTSMAMLPNTKPVLDSKSALEYIYHKSDRLSAEVLPIGAVSQSCAGEDLSEMVDLHHAGAIAFTDGTNQIQNAGLLMKALQYAKLFDGLVINQPQTAGITPEGYMHEGRISVALGLRGIPAISEVLMVKRDLDLLRYTKSRLHILNISTAESVACIRAAKEEGLAVTCSVPALNLLHNDEAVASFDANYKVLPPLRDEIDRQALIDGLKDGTIDCITSNHRPVDPEHKDLEFAYAEFGISNLETAFSISLKALGRRLSPTRFVEYWAIRPRKVLDLPIPTIERGNPAVITIFNPDAEQTVDAKEMESRSKNNPFVGTSLPGRVLGIVTKDQWQQFV